MMKFTNLYMKKMLIILFLSIIWGSNLYAQIPPVKEVKVDLQGKLVEGIYQASGVITWWYPQKDYNVDSYNIYYIDGKISDNSEFILLNNVEAEQNDKNVYSSRIENLKGNTGGWTFVITAIVGDQESEKSNPVYYLLKNDKPTDKVVIISKPMTKAALGVEYNYLPEFETNIQNPTAVYSLLKHPDGAVIDSETGEITWTPKSKGIFNFSLSLKIYTSNSDKATSTIQNWMVEIRECDAPAKISGTIKTEDGESILMGAIELISVNPDNGEIKKSRDITYKFQNGEYIIEGLDKGEYYLGVQAFSNKNDRRYYITWYENALKLSDATPIEVDCGDELVINFVVKAIPEPVRFTVSGRVTDAATEEPIVNAFVQFMGVETNSDRKEVFSAPTGKDGKYEIKLPENFSFLALATSKQTKNSNNGYWAYFPQYYKLADNPQDAVTLKITENLSGIDFALNAIPDYNNSISGKVVNKDNEPIGNVEVIAYLVDTDIKNDRYIYFGKGGKLDDFGTFTISNLVPGKYILYAKNHDKNYAPGFYNEDGIAVIKWDDATRVEVEETGNSGPYTIMLDNVVRKNGKGKVKGEVGKNKGGIVSGSEVDNALNGANVYLLNSDNRIMDELTTDDQGKYEFSNIPSGKYSLVFDKIGYYSVESTFENDGESIIEKEVEMSVKTPSTVNELVVAGLEVYPNPVSDYLWITIENDVKINSIKIFDVAGSTVTEINNYENSSSFRIDVRTLNQGAYFVKITSNNGYAIKPLIIAR